MSFQYYFYNFARKYSIMRDFIITSPQTWEYPVQTTIKNTTLEISKKNRVVYINTPLDLATCLRKPDTEEYKHRKEVLDGKTEAIRRINENLWVVDCPFVLMSINKLPDGFVFDFFNKLNNKKLAKYINKVLSELGFHDYIHLMDTDIYRGFYMKELIRPALSVYYCRDYVVGEPYFAKHGLRLEGQLAAKSDLVLCNSTHFAERFRQYNKNTYPIETGVNVDLYKGSTVHPLPSDMESIPHPIIGYTGVLYTLRLDIELLYEWAKVNADKSFVLVGPEDENFSNHRIHELSNVHFLGKKKVEELPAYIQHFDICINPQAVNNITIGNYPLKIDEYLCMGKPVIATRTHTMLDVFSEHTHLASTLEEYNDALSNSLKEIGNKELSATRMRFGESHSWGHSVAKIYDAIENTESKTTIS